MRHVQRKESHARPRQSKYHAGRRRGADSSLPYRHINQGAYVAVRTLVLGPSTKGCAMMSDLPPALRLAYDLESFPMAAADDAAYELRRLYAENEALRADAERYRFIRNPVISARTHGHIMYAVEELAEHSLDEYLDAKMKEQL
jgi:hypothetical protein